MTWQSGSACYIVQIFFFFLFFISLKEFGAFYRHAVVLELASRIFIAECS